MWHGIGAPACGGVAPGMKPALAATLDDPHLAACLPELHDHGRAPSSASTAVAAACFRARLAGETSPAGERTARVLADYRRTVGERGRGQARPFGVTDLAAVLATQPRPRRPGPSRLTAQGYVRSAVE